MHLAGWAAGRLRYRCFAPGANVSDVAPSAGERARARSVAGGAWVCWVYGRLGVQLQARDTGQVGGGWWAESRSAGRSETAGVWGLAGGNPAWRARQPSTTRLLADGHARRHGRARAARRGAQGVAQGEAGRLRREAHNIGRRLSESFAVGVQGARARVLDLGARRLQRDHGVHARLSELPAHSIVRPHRRRSTFPPECRWRALVTTAGFGAVCLRTAGTNRCTATAKFA